MMRIHVILLVALATLTGCCYHGADGEDTGKLKTRLNAIIDKWHRDAAEGNLDAYIGTMADSGVFIGTDASERWTTSAFDVFCKPHFDAGKTWAFFPFHRTVYTSEDGNTAWFDELLDTKLGLCRGSGVLQKKDGSWKIEQYVLSPTIPNDRIGDVVEEKRAADSLFISQNKR